MELSKLPYAEWLEQSLRNIVGKPVQAMCIMTKVASTDKNLDDEVGTGYWNCSCADKLVFAGFIQQDAMLDTMRANGYLPEDDEEEDSEDE